MKKLFLLLGIILTAISINFSVADDFDSINNINAFQKQKLMRIKFEFTQKNNALNARISDYNNKISRIEQDTEKTPEQISLLKDAYERSLKTLQEKQKILERETDEQYKSVFTESQYLQYKKQSN